jgi:hypothetical protein
MQNILRRKRKMAKNCYMISVDYKEFKPNTYNGVILLEFDENYKNKEILKFNTGNFVTDFNQMLKESKVEANISSQVDNYISDFNNKCTSPTKIRYIDREKDIEFNLYNMITNSVFGAEYYQDTE